MNTIPQRYFSYSTGMTLLKVIGLSVIRLLDCSRMSRPSPQAVVLCWSVSLMVLCLQVSVCSILNRWRRSFVGIKTWMTRNQVIRVDSRTGACKQVFLQACSIFVWPLFCYKHFMIPSHALMMVCSVMYRRIFLYAAFYTFAFEWFIMMAEGNRRHWNWMGHFNAEKEWGTLMLKLNGEL